MLKKAMNASRPNLRPTHEAEFAKTCVDLAVGWRIEKDGPSAGKWLELKVYDLVTFLLREDLFDDLTGQRAQQLSKRGRRAPKNPFRLVLRIIFAGRSNPLSGQNRARMGRRLQCAHRHLVPIEFLHGFLREVKVADKAKKIIPEYRSWVIEQLCHEENHIFIENYPEKIRKSVLKRCGDDLRP
jgi:hypothetical protein